MMTLSLGYENPLRGRFTDDFFKTLPQEPGVYFFLDRERRPLYVGKADCLRKRLQNYRIAKPGQEREHIIEMLELAHFIEWEIQGSGELALAREGELIQALQPPFNRTGVDSTSELFIGVRFDSSGTKLSTEFRLSHWELDAEYFSFGSFQPRGRTKQAYSALLRLIFAAECERERFLIPAKLTRSSPAYEYRSLLSAKWKKPLLDFLSGRNSQILKSLLGHLLEKENLQPHLYAPLQRDLLLLKNFFAIGPRLNRDRAHQTGVKGSLLRRQQRNELVVGEFRRLISDSV